jgi:ubiquinone/menaquinone biosynthesis C-methylase UbiE
MREGKDDSALRALFDDQAGDFDRRAGLPADVPEKIAQALGRMAGLDSGNGAGPGEGSGLLEIGAGTGEIGIHLAGLPARYLGLDRSLPMLKAFRVRGGAAARLVQADGNAPWPVSAGTVGLVFGSRSLHYLRVPHLASELRRVASRRGIALVAGRIRREDGSVKEEMRRRMRHLLKGRGFTGLGGRNRDAVGDALAREGWTPLGPLVVASWEVASSPLQSLESWRGKAGLAGLEVPDGAKRAVLEELEGWARERFGDLSVSVNSIESYVLEGMRYAE